MDLKEYQNKALTTFLLNPKSLEALYYTTLGLAGEAGEVANKVKKIIRGDYTLNESKENISAELGDVLWYVSVLSKCLDIDINDIAQHNLDKLQKRKLNGTIKGSGDNR